MWFTDGQQIALWCVWAALDDEHHIFLGGWRSTDVAKNGVISKVTQRIICASKDDVDKCAKSA